MKSPLLTRTFRLTAPVLPLILACFLNAARADDLTPAQLEEIRKQLEGLNNELADINLKKNTTLTGLFLDASGSPKSAISFYLDCVEEVNFTRLGRRETDFRAWKDDFQPFLESSDLAELLQIQLRYLAISTDAARSDDLETVFPRLTQYIDSLTSMAQLPDPPAPRRQMRGYRDRDDRGGARASEDEDPPPPPPPPGGTIDQTAFAVRYDLQGALQKMSETWELDSLNVGGMYDKTVMPFLRTNQPEQVLSAWQRRITQEGRMATVRGDAAEEAFRRVTLPELQWKMMVDEYAIGPKAQAVAKMLAHINTYKTTHPKAGDWLEQLTQLLAPGSSRPQTVSSPPAAPGPR